MTAYALLEDGGRFLAGRVLSESDSSAQVELDSGKRVKAKAAQLLLRFAAPAPAALIAQASEEAAGIDLDLAWTFAPEDEFGFADVAREYYSAQPTPVQLAATLMALHEAPHYFRRAGKGRFRKAAQETVQAALAAIERKRLQAEQIAAWAQELAAGRTPEPVREQLYKILFRPDKNAPEYKAVVEATRLAHQSPLDLLKSAGAIQSPYQFHWRRFLFEHFPKGTGFASVTAPEVAEPLPEAEGVAAFSIDDSSTTEIDDALSVRGLGSGQVVFGIHIAAPGLAIAPGSPVDRIARERLSTVYMPGHKLTMLPDAVVQRYTLTEGQSVSAVSLYTTFDEATLAIVAQETRLERVPIAANLRLEQLEAEATEERLTGAEPAPYRFAAELGFAFRLARHLKAAREVVRGKPETFNRPDFSFKLRDAEGAALAAEPQGDEQVVLEQRKRGSPVDLIVSEAMILANSSWARQLDEAGLPGLFRSQASLAPGIKVRMGTRALPHAGMGVSHYGWATSPLRRYTDLVNQWQIIALTRHGRTAGLAAPFKPRDASLMGVLADFEAAYMAYNGFQQQIERYWTIRHLAQQGIQEVDASVMVNGLARADTLPLVLRAVGSESLPRGTRVRLRIELADPLSLEVQARVLHTLDSAATAVVDEEDEAPAAGGLALAIDAEGEAAGEAPPEAGAAGSADAAAAAAASRTPPAEAEPAAATGPGPAVGA